MLAGPVETSVGVVPAGETVVCGRRRPIGVSLLVVEDPGSRVRSVFSRARGWCAGA